MSWLVLCEVEGSIVMKSADSAADATQMADDSMRGGGPDKATAAGVVLLDHGLRSAQVLSYRRGLQRLTYQEDEEKPIPSPGAYDLLCSFGYDIDKELRSGNQPPADKVNYFVQKLGIPVLLTKRVESAAPASDKPKKSGMGTVYIGVGIGILVIVLAMAFLLKGH